MACRFIYGSGWCRNHLGRNPVVLFLLLKDKQILSLGHVPPSGHAYEVIMRLTPIRGTNYTPLDTSLDDHG